MRFIAFIDILGFGSMIESTPLPEIINRLYLAFNGVTFAQHLNILNEVLPLTERATISEIGSLLSADARCLDYFSFSDTFVLSSTDDSNLSFFQIVVGTAILTQQLFAMKFPVRGAITFGEAEAIPGTHHLVGRAIVRAAKLEKAQDWFGAIIDPELVNNERLNILRMPMISPLVVPYVVPVKSGSGLSGELQTINWRFNLTAQEGIASLLPPSEDPSAMKKRNNTLEYCHFLRQNRLAWGRTTTASGKSIHIPWLQGVHSGGHRPDHSTQDHEDGY
jgi:hypothetical protein